MSGLERVDTLAAHAGGDGQLVGTHAPLLAHPLNRPPEDEQVCVSVFALRARKAPKLR